MTPHTDTEIEQGRVVCVECSEDAGESVEHQRYTCGAMTFPGRRYVDPEPPEYCEEEVEQEGDLCPRHEGFDDEDPRWEDD